MLSPTTTPQGAFRSLPTELVRFGSNAISYLAEDIESLGAHRVFVIASRSVANNQTIFTKIKALIGKSYVGTFSDVRPHVPSSVVFAAAQAAIQQSTDLLISIGGGSAIDCAKLAAFVMAGGAKDPDSLFRMASSYAQPKISGAVPHIAISTTLSAAEFSCAAGVTDEASHVKGVLTNIYLAPRVVVLDPTLTLSTPSELWLSTGIKALDHAIERLCALNHQPLIDTLCIEAARLLTKNLPASTGSDELTLVARAQCQIGAWLSFYGWLNVPTGLSHVLGHQIGARFGIPHGYTSGITLPHVIRLVHAKSSPEQFVGLARALGVDSNPEAAAAAVAGLITGLVQKFSLPANLRALGVPHEQIALIAAAAFDEMKRSGRLSAGQTLSDVAHVVQAAW
jgi:alcohol dehydrogenase class IV